MFTRFRIYIAVGVVVIAITSAASGGAVWYIKHLQAKISGLEFATAALTLSYTGCVAQHASDIAHKERELDFKTLPNSGLSDAATRWMLPAP